MAKHPVLVRGQVSKQHLNALLSLTFIRSPAVKKALDLHFVKGLPCRQASIGAEISESHLSQNIKKLREISDKVQALFPFYQADA